MAHLRTDPTGASLTARRRIRAGGSCLHMCTENPGDVKPGPWPPARSASSGSRNYRSSPCPEGLPAHAGPGGGTRLAGCDDMDVNPTPSTRAAIARSLRDMAGLLELAGDSPFRARAYERAAKAIELSMSISPRSSKRSA